MPNGISTVSKYRSVAKIMKFYDAIEYNFFIILHTNKVKIYKKV